MYEYDNIFMVIHNYSADLTDGKGNLGASTAAQEALLVFNRDTHFWQVTSLTSFDLMVMSKQGPQ